MPFDESRLDASRPKQRRGFACMSPEKRRAIAAKGGAATPPEKRSFYRDRQLAALAGSAGGSAPHRDRKGGPRKAGG